MFTAPSTPAISGAPPPRWCATCRPSTDWLRGGPALLLPERTSWSLSLASDSRRPTQGTLDLAYAGEPASGSRSRSISPFWNVRGSDFWQASLGAGWREDVVGWQFAGQAADAYLVGRLRQRTFVHLARRADPVAAPLAPGLPAALRLGR